MIVNTPKYGRKVFTGKTHMPTPSKFRWVVNVNVLNNAKHHYDMVRNVDPNIEMPLTQDIEMTSDVNHNDIAFAANSWMEFTYPEMTVTVSNPWVQIWKGGIRPLYDTRNDLDTFAGVAAKLSDMTGDKRMRDYFKFVYQNRVDVYAQRMLDASQHLLWLQRRRDAEVGKGLDGDGADLSAASVLGGDERIEAACGPGPGGIENYRTEPEAIEYGENFILHREGTEATPYLPNAIMTTNPYVRPDDYGIPITAQHHDDKTVRNIKLPWQEIKRHANPLWEKGYQFYCVTPEDPASGAQPMVGERLGADLRVELRGSLPDGQTDAGGGRAPVAYQPAGGERPRDQRRRLCVCGRQSGGPALSGLEAVGSVLQGGAADDPGQVQPGLSVPCDDGEACAVRVDAEVGQGP